MQTFTFNETDTPIRIKTVGGETWFVAKDVSKALNITWSGHTLDQIPDDWKGSVKFSTPGGIQELLAINEAGMYKLAFRCHSSKASDKFTNWVASEVMPSIRKTGRYNICSPVNRTNVRKKRGEGINADILGLLWLIGESLWRGDQKEVAMELGVSVQTVNYVLNGTQRSPRVLMALYRKAQERRMQGTLYVDPKGMSERLLECGRVEPMYSLPAANNKKMEGGER